MIYVPECRVCGQEELAPDCLKQLQICGACWIAPNPSGFNLDYTGWNGKDRNPC